MKDRRVFLVSLITLMAFVSGGWLMQRPVQRNAGTRDSQRLFEQVLGYVADLYVDSVDISDLYELAIEGMLDQLNDPYTSFLRPREYQELSLSTTGNYGGVGIRIESRDGWVTIVGPLADTPGERAGLTSGDQITAIEGKSTEGWTTDQAAALMRGEPGTDVQLTIVRAGLDEPLHFTITRALIHVNYVEGSTVVAPGIGYLNLTSVSQTAPRELMEAINELRSQGGRELILDLRTNPGGVLDQGVAIADLFLDRGDRVVEMKGRAERASQIFTDERPQLWPDMLMIVLVGSRTASAAEIIAGALQDHDRALILGTRTFGKGTAYTLLRLTEAEALTVTTSRWYTPSGRSIDRPRFRHLPDQNVARALATQDSLALDTTVAYRSESGRLLKGGGGIQPDVEVLDTLTAPEQEFAQALGADVPKYRDALARYSLDIKARNTITDEDFVVTDAMLQELLTLLRQKGATMPDSIWFGARDFLAEQLGLEITRYVFGRPAELHRRLRHDVQVARAIALFQRANTQEQLLAIASSN